MGNQLFSYAAARRLALVNGAELVIDDRSGFVRDHNYRRSYQLEHFRIPCRKASAAELLAPFPRIRRYLKRTINRRRPFHERSYVQQEGYDFDPRLLGLKPRSTVYLGRLLAERRLFQGRGGYDTQRLAYHAADGPDEHGYRRANARLCVRGGTREVLRRTGHGHKQRPCGLLRARGGPDRGSRCRCTLLRILGRSRARPLQS